MADKIYYNDGMSDATLTALSEATGFEKEYAIDNTPSTVWRTTGIASETMLIDFGSALLPLAFAWINSNIVSGDTTYTISAGTTTACVDYSENLTKAAKGVHEINAAWLARRYWKITVTKASGTYVEFGKMAMLFSEYEYVKTHRWGYSTGLLDVFSSNPGKYGQNSRELMFTKKMFNLTFKYIATAQKIMFDETIRVYPYIFYYDNDNSEVWYGEAKFSTPEHNDTGYWTMNLSFTEVK